MKKETVIKVNRNERFVLSSTSINYKVDKENNYTMCYGEFKLTFRGFTINTVTIYDYCIKSPNDIDNEVFAKKLARAKMERKAYTWLKSYFMNTDLHGVTSLTISVEKKKINPHRLIKYINNSIRFAEDIIEHQNHYIYKVLNK